MNTTKCKHCGSDRYEIRFIYMGQRQKLFIVHCGECGSEFSPVVVDYFAPADEVNFACESAWNAANAKESESAEPREQGQAVAEVALEEMMRGSDARQLRIKWLAKEYPPPGTLLYTTPPTPPAGVPDGWIEAMRDALSACSSVSISRDHRVVRDESVLYLQTEEWCNWLETEIAPKLRAMLSAAPQSEDIPAPFKEQAS